MIESRGKHASRMLPHIRRHTVRVILLSLVGSVGLILWSGHAYGQVPCSVTWDGGAGTDNWADAANWSGDSVPSTSDSVCIPNTALSLVLIDSVTTATIQAIDSAETLRVEGNLSLTDTGVDSTISNLELNGTLDGWGTLTVDGSLSWAGGSMGGSGTTVIGSTGTLSIDPGNFGSVNLGMDLAGRVLDNQGTATWSSGFIQAGANSLLQNSGTFDAQSETGYYCACNGLPAIHNTTGTFQKTASTGITAIYATFDNDGETWVSSGELDLQGGDGTQESTGVFSTSSGAVLAFTSGDFDLSVSSSVVGAGTVRVSAGSVTVAGTFDPTHAEVSGGTLTLNADATPHNVSLSSGTLDGSGTLTVDGSLSWAGGSMGGSGTTVIGSTGTLSIDPGNFGSVNLGMDLAGRVLDNQGTATWSSGFIQAGANSLLQNSGTFDAQSETGYYCACNGLPAIHNTTGTFQKTASTGITAIYATFDNDGETSVSSGELDLQGGDGTQESTGVFSTSSGAILRFASGDYDLASGASLDGVRIGAHVTIADGANVHASGANVLTGTLDGSGTLTVDGSLSWAGGSMGGSGTTVIASTGTLSIDPGNFGSVNLGMELAGRVLDNQGTATWSSGSIAAGEASLLLNEGTFSAHSGTGIYCFCYGSTPPAIHNTGTFTGIATIQANVTNDGTVSPGLSPGTLMIQADYVQTALGSLAVEVNGATPGTDFDVLSVTGTASLDGHLGVSTGASFTPSLGETFKIVQAGTRIGTFASVSGLDLGGGKSYSVQYNPADVTLQVGTVPPPHTLNVSVTGSGQVASDDGKIGCPPDCSASYDQGTSVTLTATPDIGFSFTGWGGDCTSFGTDPCALTMDADKTASATFVAIPHTLNVSLTGSGQVTSADGGIACPGDCIQVYDEGTSVTLTATPDSGFSFTGWGGDCTSFGTDPCALTMDADKTASATFVAIPHTLNVSVTGSGHVTSADGGIACPGDCIQVYDEGTSVTLTATPDTGFSFSGWGGDCSGTTNPCVLTMDADKTASATFKVIPPERPGAPTGVAASPGNASAVISWTPPTFDGGSPIDGYELTCTATGNPADVQTATTDGSATSATVTGLTNGVEYTCTVQAHNEAGFGPGSEPSNPVTPSDTVAAGVIDTSVGGTVDITPTTNDLGTSGEIVVPAQPGPGKDIVITAALFGTPGARDPSCGGRICIGQGIEWHLSDPDAVSSIQVVFLEEPFLVAKQNIKAAKVYKNGVRIRNCTSNTPPASGACVQSRHVLPGGSWQVTLLADGNDPRGHISR
jgi:phage baseplate assembly protein gpV